MQNSRKYSIADQLCIRLDKVIKTLSITPVSLNARMNPADAEPELPLNDLERQHSAGLMRVNHVGEVCAQALYRGQALTAHLLDTRQAMEQAAAEEQDHLRWCEERLQQLNSHTSYLNPVWYVGALTIGTMAGILGDKWSLGFVVETERQVVAHLTGHQQKLVERDKKSQAIIAQMAIDEAHHAEMALAAGAAELPVIVKYLMRASAKIMTTTAYWV